MRARIFGSLAGFVIAFLLLALFTTPPQSAQLAGLIAGIVCGFGFTVGWLAVVLYQERRP